MNVYPPGTRIGQYEIASRPLVGGMGIVYVCRDLEQDRPVALKTFKPEYLPDRAARDRFLREGTHWVDLGAHPHVVRCYQVLRIDPEVYLVLELVAKEQGREDASLRSWLTPGRPLPLETALLFALQIARGLKHATAVIPGFVHRDLKPENVLVGADRLAGTGVNRLRVTDFGLAAVLEGRDQGAASSDQDTSSDQGSQVTDPLRRTQLTHGIVGTPLYIAPEQWRGEPVGIYTDVYALGCILLEMLTGRRAVEGGSLGALERAHCAGVHPALPAGVPEGVCALVGRWLAVDRGARGANWEEVEGALAAAYVGVSGRPAPAAEGAVALSREERVAAGWSYSEMGASYLDIGKAKMARGYFERVVGVGQAEGERQLEGAGVTHLGLAYAALGDARRAIGYCEQALAIAHEIGDRHGEGAALGNLGNASAALGDARRAIGYYEQQLVITREIGDRGGEENALGNLGNAYVRLGDARRAIGYYEQALAIAHGIGDRRGEGAALGNLGGSYADLGDTRRAIRYYEQASVILEEVGDVMAAVGVSFNLALLLAQQGRPAEALPYAQRAAQVFARIGHPEYAQRAQALVAQLQGKAH